MTSLSRCSRSSSDSRRDPGAFAGMVAQVAWARDAWSKQSQPGLNPLRQAENLYALTSTLNTVKEKVALAQKDSGPDKTKEIVAGIEAKRAEAADPEVGEVLADPSALHQDVVDRCVDRRRVGIELEFREDSVRQVEDRFQERPAPNSCK